MGLRNNSAARELLFRMIRQDGPYRGIRVNSRYCMSTNHPLVKDLIKRGLVKTVRESHGSANCRKTELVPADGVYVAGPVHCPECKTIINRLSNQFEHKSGCTVAMINFFRVPDHASNPLFHKAVTPAHRRMH